MELGAVEKSPTEVVGDQNRDKRGVNITHCTYTFSGRSQTRLKWNASLHHTTDCQRIILDERLWLARHKPRQRGICLNRREDLKYETLTRRFVWEFLGWCNSWTHYFCSFSSLRVCYFWFQFHPNELFSLCLSYRKWNRLKEVPEMDRTGRFGCPDWISWTSLTSVLLLFYLTSFNLCTTDCITLFVLCVSYWNVWPMWGWKPLLNSESSSTFSSPSICSLCEKRKKKRSQIEYWGVSKSEDLSVSGGDP